MCSPREGRRGEERGAFVLLHSCARAEASGGWLGGLKGGGSIHDRVYVLFLLPLSLLFFF